MILIEIMLTSIKYCVYKWRGYVGAYRELQIISSVDH